MYKLKLRDRETFEIIHTQTTESIAFLRGFVVAVGLLTNYIIHVELNDEEIPLSTII